MKKILLVESNESMRRFYLEALNRNGYKILETGIPTKVLELILEESPDVIALPEKMPGLDSIELIEILKREKRFIPTILMSESGADRQNFRLWSSGAEVVLTGDIEELKLKITSILKE